MARIELPQNRGLVETAVPEAGSQIRTAGREYDALTELGGAFAKLGIQLQEKRTQAETEDYAFNRAQDDHVEISDYAAQLKLDTKPGTKEYSTQLKQYLDDRFQKNLEDAPTNEARKAYQEKAGHIYSNNLVEGEVFENKRNVEAYQQNTLEKVDLLSQEFENNPRYDTYKARIDEIKNHVDNQVGSLYDEESATKLKEKLEFKTSLGIMNGIHAKGQSSEGLKLLGMEYDKKNRALKPIDGYQESDISKGLGPDQKAIWLDRFDHTIKSDHEITKQEVNNDVTDMVHDFVKKGVVDMDKYHATMFKIQESGIRGPEAAKLRSTLEAGLAAGREIEKLDRLPIDQVLKFESKISTTGFNSSTKDAIATQVENYKDLLIKNAQSDSHQYILDQNPKIKLLDEKAKSLRQDDVQALVNATKAAQSAMNFSPRDQRVSSKETTQRYADLITAAPNATVAAQTMAQIEKAYGADAPAIFRDMEKDNRFDANGGAYLVAAHVDDLNSKKVMIENIKNGKAVNLDYKTSFGDDSRKAILNYTNNKMMAVDSALYKSDPSGAQSAFSNGLKYQVMTEAQKIMLGSHTTEQDAVDKAYSNIVDKNFVPVTSERSTFLLPRMSNGQPVNQANVETYVRAHSSVEGFDSLNLQTPASYKAKFPNSSDSELKSLYYNKLEQRNRWKMTPTGTGIMLIDEEPNNGNIPVLEKSKKVIQKSFKEIDLRGSDSKELQQKTFKRLTLGAKFQ